MWKEIAEQTICGVVASPNKIVKQRTPPTMSVITKEIMKQLIYIKVYKGFMEARTVGENNESQFRSEGLNHPRSLAGNFIEVEKTFKKVISTQPKVLLGLIKPTVLIHLVPEMEGGYTDLELRFFREAALGGGASKVFLMTNKFGPQLDSELNDVKKWL